ncbi:uncharacterized protein LOC132728117 [Ruditapes philippinarum]|uniref:uncharacterized protein LOC132728117 n=1 Tax=Ruditapes philippinarum TaxID=129788 RepID=UPI00295BFAA2|nr:uncharacterized protein LOC132728117 [Ruditapes philippinarum]
MTVGNQTVSTNNIPCMELVQTFDEVYLLSNFITDGSINQEVVLMPLYLSQLRLAVINGFKGQSEEKWNAFRRKLDRVASSIEFDNEFGNLNIAEYDPRAVHTDTTYSYIEPTSYSSFISLVNKSAVKSVDTTVFNREQQRREGLNVYEEIDNIARERQSARRIKYCHAEALTKQAQKKYTEQIDGRMLILLDKDMLKEDFDMKGVEALRLVTFAKEGHLPN